MFSGNFSGPESLLFEEVPEEQIREARQWMDRCDRVICCRENFGTWDRANAALRTYAKESGKL